MREPFALVQHNDYQVRGLIADVLEDLGFVVIKCEDGFEARAALNNDEAQFKLLICDLENELDVALVEEAQRRRPKVNSILVVNGLNNLGHPADILIHMPINPKALETCVKSLPLTA